MEDSSIKAKNEGPFTHWVNTTRSQTSADEQRDLNHLVHWLLVVGVITSTVLMLLGLGLDLAASREVPTTTPGFAETIQRAAALRPSGLFTLGILVLIATPILRVVGSIITFVYERNWHYALITSIVLLIVLISVASGVA